mmetsp:Transcript_98577/g.316342  ORF Transcript_98577/g.316342 Transcript_98577/m.316342 type:complete len:80 (+) Transcript_98577:228-467(+)
MLSATAEQQREKIELWADERCPMRDWTELELAEAMVSGTVKVDEKINDEGTKKVSIALISLRCEDDSKKAELEKFPNFR